MQQAWMQAKGRGGCLMLCLMPTYGRRRELLNNSLACFNSQQYAQKTLLIYDDLGTLNGTQVDMPNVHIMSTPHRSSSVGNKYNVMVRFAELVLGLDTSMLAVWDDDDIYRPFYLCTHAEILANHSWSKPSTIVSAFHQPPATESANGRFHGSIALRRELAGKVGGWIDTTRATFDQEFLSLLTSESPPGDPCDLTEPQYVYRWQTSHAGHCSGLMGSPTWYADYQPDSREPIDRLWPEFDADTLQISTSARVTDTVERQAIRGGGAS
jgi:hypothetical protein